jgi:uncharacterized protein with HEPN domain
MFDKHLVLSILIQIEDALQKIASRAGRFRRSADEFTDSPSGMEALDSICMLFMATGEALKNIDKITGGDLLSQYPEIDWKGAIGFRDIIAHQYFDIDAEQVFWICTRELAPLSAAIQKMIEELR